MSLFGGFLRQARVRRKQHAARKSYVSCNRPCETLTVAWDSEVVPGCNDHDKKEPLGNLRTPTLKVIWNGGPMRRLREQFVTGRI